MFAIVVVLLAMAAGYYFYSRRNTFNVGTLRGKRVLVTGSSGNIGENVAMEYARAGARLVLAARREAELQRVAQRCKELGAEQVEYVVTDFANPLNCDNVVRETQRLLGGLDHLILNHVAYYGNWWTGSEEDMTILRNQLNVNVISYVDVASKCLDMLTESGGNIGVISSVEAKVPLARSSMHTTCKSAVEGFFATLRQELVLKNVPISVTICVLGAIATIYERESVTYFGRYAGTVEDTAVAIVRGVTSRADEIYYPVAAKIATWTHKFFPRTTERYAYTCFEPLL